MKLFNTDCRKALDHIDKNSVDLMICDPPFGINETAFDNHYKREASSIIPGYVEAPEDKTYEEWTFDWLEVAKDVMKDDASMYLVSGWSRLREVLNACERHGFNIVNHIIWKFNFGVWTTTKYISSHYHILYMGKSKKAKLKFNCDSRYGFQEKDGKSSLQNIDRQDVFAETFPFDYDERSYFDRQTVWHINKEYHPGELKNENKLPNDLVQKMIQYSSNKDDTVCDFFMGNFTTAYVARDLGRHVIGFELNQKAFDYHKPKVEALEFGGLLKKLPPVTSIKPENQGQPVTEDEAKRICKMFNEELKKGHKKKDISETLQAEFGRGKFAIVNILHKYLDKYLD